MWNYSDNKELWDTYGELAVKQDLIWGGNWKFKDYPHIQNMSGTNPLKTYTPIQIKKMLNI